MEHRDKALVSPTPSRWRHNLKSKKFIVLAACLVFCVVAAVYISTDRAVAIVIDGQKQQVFTSDTTVSDILAENNITIYEGDLVQPALSAKVSKNDTIQITRAFDFSVYADCKKTVIHSTPVTVQEALAMAGVELGELDQVSEPLDTEITSPKKIIVARVNVEYVNREVTVDSPVEVRRDDSLAVGQTKVLQQGSAGLKQEVLAIYTKDGTEMTRKVTQSTVIKEAQPTVVAQGSLQMASRSASAISTSAKTSVSSAKVMATSTKPTASSKTSPSRTVSASKTTSSNSSLSGASYLTVKAYAYSGDGHTAMGTATHRGVIAVDPDVIPLGTKVYVEGYGYATAEDTGGDIQGKTIDCFMETESECVNWGVKHVKIYLL